MRDSALSAYIRLISGSDATRTFRNSVAASCLSTTNECEEYFSANNLTVLGLAFCDFIESRFP